MMSDASGSQIENLSIQVSSLQDKVIELENDIDRLKNFIRQLDDIGPEKGVNFKGWEVMAILQSWVGK